MTKPKAARQHVKSPGDKFVSDVDLAGRYRVHRATIWRWAGNGTLPAPVQITEGCTRWIEAEVDAADKARAAARPSFAGDAA